MKPSPEEDDPPVRLVYVGPHGQTSPLFGGLTVGTVYEAAADLAAYLVATHPEYWQPATSGTGVT